MAAALRRLVLPTFSRRLASGQPKPSFTGTAKAAQGRKAGNCTSLRSYSSEAAAYQERKELLMYKQARADLLWDLSIWASVTALGYMFYRDYKESVERASSRRLSDVRSSDSES